MFEDSLKLLTDRCEKVLLTKNEFVWKLKDILKDDSSPIEDFLFIIDKQEPFQNLYIGNKEIENTCDDKRSILSTVNAHTLNKIQMFLKLKTGSRHNSYDLFEKLFQAFWRVNVVRENVSLLLPYETADMPQIILNTIQKITNDKDCAIVFADIDHFKNVNDTYSQDTGDYLIKKVTSIIENYSINSIPIHRSGDEFIIIHPSNKIEDVIILTDNIRNDIKEICIKHKNQQGVEEDIELNLSLSFGIHIIEKGQMDLSLDFSDYLTKAEKSLKLPNNGGKERGKIRINHNTVEKVEINTTVIQSAMLKSKLNLLNDKPFSNIWLNFVVSYIEKIDSLRIEKLNDSFNQVIEIVSPVFGKYCISAIPNSSLNYTHEISVIDLMLAFLSGVIKNKDFQHEMKNITINYDVDNHLIELLVGDDSIIKYPNQPTTLLEKISNITLSSLPNIIRTKDYMNGKISNSLLIIIGNEYDKKYDELFNVIINVDNRPMTGGGLPDFWEAAIANLINSISNNKNIKNVFILGDNTKITKISKLLLEINVGNINDMNNISYKTGYSISMIDSIFKNLQGHISFCEDEGQLINQVFGVEFSTENSFDLTSIDYSNQRQKKGYLKQKVNLEEFKLAEYDGCRGESLRKIYPVVINNIREINLPINTDFSNKNFKELTDYKIILTKPSDDAIPWFYEKDKESFDEYYQNNFLEDKGTFHKKLNASNQVGVVINHIVEHLKKSNKKKIINTRRAIIILDNEINENKLEPVGLISIRIYHNLNSDGSISINFTYVWRTVEVIVGLPYSMYGSIQYSNFLLQKIIEKLEGEVDLDINIKNIKLGSLTYIAQSLHIFKDSYSENIAKNIVDEATI